MLKNYHKWKDMGASSCFTSAVHTGEVACAGFVINQTTAAYSHMAMQMNKRAWFNPVGYYSDIYPHGKAYWQIVAPGAQGCLGLFHLIQRITDTLRKSHEDHGKAISELLDSAKPRNGETTMAVTSVSVSGMTRLW